VHAVVECVGAGVDVSGGSGVDLVLGGFCCLGDILGAGSGTGVAVVARMRGGWSRFGQLAPFLATGTLLCTYRGRCLVAVWEVAHYVRVKHGL